eukprot:8147026-Pyramimonas_sp.AAC.1
MRPEPTHLEPPPLPFKAPPLRLHLLPLLCHRRPLPPHGAPLPLHDDVRCRRRPGRRLLRRLLRPLPLQRLKQLLGRKKEQTNALV